MFTTRTHVTKNMEKKDGTKHDRQERAKIGKRGRIKYNIQEQESNKYSTLS